MSFRLSVRRQNVRSAKCLSAKCLSARCLSAKCPGTTFSSLSHLCKRNGVLDMVWISLLYNLTWFVFICSGQTALHKAAIFKQPSICTTLVHAGADIARKDYNVRNSQNANHWAIIQTGTLTQYSSSLMRWNQASFSEFWVEILEAKDWIMYQIEVAEKLYLKGVHAKM